MDKKKKNISIDTGGAKWAPPGPDEDFPFSGEPKEADYFSSKEDEFHHSGVLTGELSLDELINIIRSSVNDVLLKHNLIDGSLQDENETDLMTTYAAAKDKQDLKDAAAAGVDSINEQTFLRFRILSGIKPSKT